MGLVRPYPIEWDATPYPPRFKASTLHNFDCKRSSNQHIYNFMYQTGNVVSMMLSWLFIHRYSQGVTFEWFMKLHVGSIKKWADLGKVISGSLL